MKKIILILLLIVSEINAQPEFQNQHKNSLSWSFAYINDNYSATWLNGKSENYIGADDFLTASFLLRFYKDTWKAAITYNTITSRYFFYRYDLLKSTLAKTFIINDFFLQPELGIMYKGNLAGAEIQNTWHQIRGIEKVKIPYAKEKGLAFIAAINSFWQKKSILKTNDLFTGALELRINSDFEPSRFTPYWSYSIDIWAEYLKFEFLNGWRIFMNKHSQYSEMTESGLLVAMNLKIKTYKYFYTDIGFSMTPARNLKEDPVFGNGSFNYLPQMWIVFSWKTPWQSIRDFIDY